jgi:hypothetical protein
MRLTDQVMDFIPRSFYAFPLPQKKRKKHQMIIKRTDLRLEKKRADFLFFFYKPKVVPAECIAYFKPDFWIRR